MAFDRGNPADLLALKTEIETDPIGMGYVLTKITQMIKLINEPADNVGGETVQGKLTPETLIESIDFDELGGNQVGTGGRSGLSYIFSLADGIIDFEQFRQKILDTFPSNGPTVAAINALVRALSRAEVLFGEETLLVREDWFAARDS